MGCSPAQLEAVTRPAIEQRKVRCLHCFFAVLRLASIVVPINKLLGLLLHYVQGMRNNLLPSWTFREITSPNLDQRLLQRAIAILNSWLKTKLDLSQEC
jgi:hypothetical protein